MSYKDTVFLPKTDFAMRGNLPQKEPEVLASWKNIYQTLRTQSEGRKKYIINFGPPYANGNLHIGHALTYILKDIVAKTYQMRGFDVPMIVGWDCHGLPIEWKVEEGFRAEGKKKEDVPPLEFRRMCREFAAKWLDIQREELKRLGIIADFDEPYSTMNFNTEGLIVEQLGHFLMDGSLYRGLRPVFWSVVEQTALADAEIEYKTVTSPSIYVAFPVQDHKNLYAIIWTTTPWTLPANRAIAYNPELEYVVVTVQSRHPRGSEDPFVESQSKQYIIAKRCVERFVEAIGINAAANKWILDSVTTRPLEDDLGTLKCHHPLYEDGYTFDVPLLPADHVTIDAGSGLVHTAPTHGEDDFALGKKFNLEMPDIIDDAGIYRANVPLFAGKHIFKVAPDMSAALTNRGALLSETKLEHSYPHSWRSKKPVIFRTTSQWFINIDNSGIRQKALAAIKDVNWFPKEGYNRIRSMIENRPDWCISRQRVWGTPITLFVHKETREVLRDAKVHARIVKSIKQHGGDFWFTEPNATFLGDAYNPDAYEKVKDVVDVWFDSGCVHEIVLKHRKGQQWPADLYLEGSDQHRGWFQSSLLESVGVYGKAPYKNVVTHGFVLDEKGYKMSKSLGNTVTPQDILKDYGADVLRLWISMVDYSEDVRIGKEILKRQEEIYRRFRNTLRYLLGALHEFKMDDLLPFDQMPELEQYMLHQLHQLCTLHTQCIDQFDIRRFYAELHNFCSSKLSSFYFDIRKDSLYCDAQSDIRRRATQTMMHYLFNFIVRLLAPVLSFTAEEAWSVYVGAADAVILGKDEVHDRGPISSHATGSSDSNLEHRNSNKINGSSVADFVLAENDRGSIHTQQFLTPDPLWQNDALDKKWEDIKVVRSAITNALEQARAEKKIGASLEAHVHVYSATLPCPTDLLNELCITSGLEHHEDTPPAEATVDGMYAIKIELAKGHKCERCWKTLEEVTPVHPLCKRCGAALG